MVMVLVGALLSPAAVAQVLPLPPPPRHRSELSTNIRTSFSLPWRAWMERPVNGGDILRKQLSESIAFNEPLLPASTPAAGLASQGDRGSSSRNITITVKDNPISYWYLSTTFDIYFQPQLKRAWNPDFTYSFGYDDWHPYTFSLTYANYGGNRFSPDHARGESVSRFNQGGIDLGWKFRLPLQVKRPFIEPRGAKFGYAVHYTVDPRFEDLASKGVLHWKQTASLSCTNTIWRYFYWTATAMAYPRSRQEQTWDPDYTYGFGWFDYRRNHWSVEYNNFSGNRYPWKAPGKSPGTFRSGGLTIMWNLP